MAPKRSAAPEAAAPAEAPDLAVDAEEALMFDGGDAGAGAGAGRPPVDAPAAADSLLGDEDDLEFEALQARARARAPPSSRAAAPLREIARAAPGCLRCARCAI